MLQSGTCVAKYLSLVLSITICVLFLYALFEDNYLIGNFAFAVCSLSSKEVFSYFLQPTGAHGTSPGWITIAVRPTTGLLVDRQENRRVSISFTIYGKCSNIHAYLCFACCLSSSDPCYHKFINITRALFYFFFLSACMS